MTDPEKTRLALLGLDVAPDQILWISSDGRLVYANGAACRALEYPRDDLLELRVSEVFPGISEEEWRAEWERLKEMGGVTLEVEQQSRTGRRTQFECVVRYLKDGEHEYASAFVRDSAGLGPKEEGGAAHRLEFLGVLAGGLAHDFNNLLTGIVGNLSFARMLVGPEHSATSRLAECEQAAVQGAETIQQLLTFAQGDEPIKRAVNTAMLVGGVVDSVLHGSDVQAVLDLPSNLDWLDAEEGQIIQVFKNLLINAKEAMPGGGTVTVRAVNVNLSDKNGLNLAPNRYVRLTVEDTGLGVPEELNGKIFDPYFTTKAGARGLGLTSAYTIVRRHGGGIVAGRAPGGGASFSVFLPAAVVGEEADPIPVQRSAPGSGGPRRILVMDDEEMIRELLGDMLVALGYHPVGCADGAAAVALVRDAVRDGKPFEAVILDLTVPAGMGGREAATLIREVDPSVLLIVSSGYVNDPILGDSRDHGFAGAIAKPYTVDRVAAELLRLLPVR